MLEHEFDREAILSALAPTQTSEGSSRWKTLHECEQKHDLHYVQLIRPIGGSTTLEQELGILTHACFNYVAEGIIAGTPRKWHDVLQVASEQMDEQERSVWDPFSLENAGRLLESYDAFWGPENLGFDKPVKIVAAEREMRAEIRPGLPYSCRADVLVELFGEPVVVDHKTRARARSTAGDLERELRADASIIGQSWLAMTTLGLKSPPPVWLNDLLKTKIPTFERHLVRIEMRDIDAWKLAMVQRLALEQERLEYAIPAMRNVYACVPPFGRRCQFFQYCHGSAEERERYYEKIEK